MTDVFAAAALDPRAVLAGWTLLVILWETTFVGVCLAAWRTGRGRMPAREQHAAAALAFSLALAVAAATPVVLARCSTRLPAVAAPVAAIDAPGATAVVGATSPVFVTPTATPIVDAIAGGAAFVWAIGVVALTIRLAGGWAHAGAIRRRATVVNDEHALTDVRRLQQELQLTGPVALLQSADVETPVVIGWRQPALILPADVAVQLSPEMMSALLAHELAHVKRHDYLANLLQSAAEILLFFSPAVVWMSGRIREAREYCCDDVAVEKCGDATGYARALTTLASLGTIATARTAMGISGPRLITRVRRLLQGEASPRFAAVRLAASVLALAALMLTGPQVASASAARAAWLSTSPQSSGGALPFGVDRRILRNLKAWWRGSDGISGPRPEISRALIARDANRTGGPTSVCLDDRKRTYSLGSIVPIRGERWRTARCEDRGWVEAPLFR